MTIRCTIEDKAAIEGLAAVIGLTVTEVVRRWRRQCLRRGTVINRVKYRHVTVPSSWICVVTDPWPLARESVEALAAECRCILAHRPPVQETDYVEGKDYIVVEEAD